MKKPTSDSAAAGSFLPSENCLGMPAPETVEFLATTKWDDGSARDPGSLSVTVESGLVKVALNDRCLKRTLYVTGGTLREALLAINRNLAEDTGDWRPWGQHTKKK